MKAWELIEVDLQGLKREFIDVKKRVCKQRVPQNQDIRDEVVENLIGYYNILQTWYNAYEPELEHEHKRVFIDYISYFRDWTIKSFSKVNCAIHVPIQPGIQIDPNIFEDESETESDSEDSESEEEDMAEAREAFINNATRRLPDFDGSPENLQSFLDGLDLIALNAANYQAEAVLIIKTKLKGNSRRLITNEATVAAIRATLEARIQPDTSAKITSTMMSLKQNGKPAQAFITEMEKLAEKLEHAHLSRNIPPQEARNLAFETAKSAVKSNTSNPQVKMAIQIGNFGTMDELVSKFVTLSTETQSHSVNYFKGNRYGNFKNNYGNFQPQRGRGRGNFRGPRNYNRGNFNNNRGNYNNNRGNYNNNRGNNNRNARYMQGNETDPQEANLGGN